MIADVTDANQAISAVAPPRSQRVTWRSTPTLRRGPGRIGKEDTARSLQRILDDLDDTQVDQALATPWERLPNEPYGAFEAFDAYRALGSIRTMAAAASAVDRLGDTGRYNHSFSVWASFWAWAERAGAWDAHVARLQREQAERELLARQQTVIEAQREAGQLLRRKGVEFLERIGLATGAEAIRAVAEGVKLERTAEGLPDWVLEVIGASDADLLARYEALKGSVNQGRVIEGRLVEALPEGDS